MVQSSLRRDPHKIEITGANPVPGTNTETRGRGVRSSSLASYARNRVFKSHPRYHTNDDKRAHSSNW
jgi:hypothetical protein